MSFQSEQDLSCPVCCDIFRDPVFLACTHSFCKGCLQKWWTEKQLQQCPVCKKYSTQCDPPSNLVLKNLCEDFLLKRNKRASESVAVCAEHTEKLKLFCLDHQQPVCVVCRDSKIHTGHRFSPINEAAQDHREELQKTLKPVRDKLKLFEEVKGKCDEMANHIKVQAQHTERQIKEKFEKLHHFLQEEEEARITALREEEKQKSKVMKEKIEALSRDISALSDTIRATEEEMRAENVSFLQNYKAAVERVQQRLPLDDPESVSGALINVAKHLGNLTYNIWTKMKKMVSCSPVILDPNTVGPHLILSDDLTSVQLGEKLKLPDNLERFDYCPIVLSSEGFNSGTHSWDVEVGTSTDWKVCMLSESAQRKGVPQSGLWRMGFYNGEYTVRILPEISIIVFLEKRPKRIRVQLDWDNGKVSFSDPDNNTLIYTFTHTFTDRLYLYISNLSKIPLRILPVTL